MTTGDDVFRRLQQLARKEREQTGRAAATGELLTRHSLESFLERLTRTPHARDFVLKGGILLAVYGVRRATKDIDAAATDVDVSAAHLLQVVRDVAAVDADDGIEIDATSTTVQEIRDAAEYPGLRVKVRAMIATSPVVVTWDVSTGDPIVPAPQRVSVPRVLGEPIQILGYAPETTVAEKGVTILERGTTSTRVARLRRHRPPRRGTRPQPGPPPRSGHRRRAVPPSRAATDRRRRGRLRRDRTGEMGRLAPQGAPRGRHQGRPRRPDDPPRSRPRPGVHRPGPRRRLLTELLTNTPAPAATGAMIRTCGWPSAR